ncbi:DUF1841 family protein [Woeseia oceani]|uniref:DUF1841 family protein n=1 Tax=Woeseia oceani TaxID=1548547 RepID=UPI000A85AC7D|nr:DUF1841 family protein [Woeseia oceani]
MIFGQDRNELRQMYIDAWRKVQDKQPLSPLEAQIASVLEDHPEYHKHVRQDAVDSDFMPESGQTNPFLHMGLHLALRDQLKTDRPPGVRQIAEQIRRRATDVHDAEHRMIEALAETLWEAQRDGIAPDEQRYLERLRQLLR